MNAQQAENLRILINFMESDRQRMLGMNVISHGCGSPSCAWGWAGTVPALRDQDVRSHTGLRAVFGLHYESTGCALYRLFAGASLNTWRRNDVTAEEWAVEARKVLAEHGYSMDTLIDQFARFMAKVREPVLSPEDAIAAVIDANTPHR